MGFVLYYVYINGTTNKITEKLKEKNLSTYRIIFKQSSSLGHNNWSIAIYSTEAMNPIILHMNKSEQ